MTGHPFVNQPGRTVVHHTCLGNNGPAPNPGLLGCSRKALLIGSENNRADTISAGITKIDRLLRPRSIALLGASSAVGSLGGAVLANLEQARFSGDLYLVNPKRPVINGHPCLGSIADLPASIDCAVLAIPGSAVLESARACAEKGVGSLIVFSAGFAEGGEAGREAQQELARIAREHNMVLEGPNCLGMVNYVDGIPLTFVVTPMQPPTSTAGAAILSQSGALAAVIAVNMRHHGIPLTYSVSTGNEAASGVEDYLEHLIANQPTRVFALIVEQFREPRRFLALVRRARAAGKFIVLLHPGRSQAAQTSAATHTGAIAGDYQLMHTLVTHAGAIHVETLEELVDVTQCLVRCRQLPGAGAAIFTESGAFKALALDLCERCGLELPALTATAERALRAVLPAFIPASNPLDLTAQGLVDPSLYRRTLPPVLEDDRFGSVLLGIILTDPQTTQLKVTPILDAVRTLKPQKPMLFAALDEGAPSDFVQLEELRELGVACFPSAERAIRALAYVTALPAWEAERPEKVVPRSKVRTVHGLLPEYKSKEILAEFGIPIPNGRLANSLHEAMAIAQEIGFPVVLKAQAVDLPHKSDAGGVILGIESTEALAEAWLAIHGNVQTYRKGLTLDGVLVESMSPKGLELILGARQDPQWGPVLLIGMGGVLAEALQDTRLLPPGLSRSAIEQELNKLRCGPLLRGFRRAAPLDTAAVADVVYRLGELIQAAPEIEEVDINPLTVYSSGVVALDALISISKK